MNYRIYCWIVLFASLAAPSAYAGDGRIEINQARAIAGGVAASDTPGFPVTIEANNSYVLTSDLDAGSANGIFGAGNNMTLDLNGFTIRGDGTATGIGIHLTGDNLEIRNGAVTGFAGDGLRLKSTGHHSVRQLRLISNGGDGIESSGVASITDCYLESNSGNGISVQFGSYIARNNVFLSGEIGIEGDQHSLIEGNLVTHYSNSFPAVSLSPLSGAGATGYRANIIANVSSGGTVTGGQDMGGNLCNGSTTCP